MPPDESVATPVAPKMKILEAPLTLGLFGLVAETPPTTFLTNRTLICHYVLAVRQSYVQTSSLKAGACLVGCVVV